MKITVNPRIACTFAMASAFPLAGSAAGFLEDASANLNLRNF